MSAIARETPGSSYQHLVNEIRRVSRMSAAELADLTGVRERQVHNWAAGVSRPQDDSRDRLVDVHYIVKTLSEIYVPEGVEIWLHGRNRGLGGRRPIELLLHGDFEPVVREVESLNSGAM
ncbi:MAG TPA: helix-turn-helix transcriptional regulator [Egibacteraceae bacterium]|nr:helix-turn-helix transcriptional regulator [Egibacteraceae bacterium]